eukprot:scaffold748_cov251-Pinguiococcus_pyrenoidosus.AAC.57
MAQGQIVHITVHFTRTSLDSASTAIRRRDSPTLPQCHGARSTQRRIREAEKRTKMGRKARRAAENVEKP